MEYVIKNDKAIIRLDKGDEIGASLLKFAENENVGCGSISGIGATDDLWIGVYDLDQKQYVKRELKGNREILSLCGNFSKMNDKPYLHLHITTQGKEDYAIGGHLLKCVISMTSEIFVDIYDVNLTRELDPSVGINTFKF